MKENRKKKKRTKFTTKLIIYYFSATVIFLMLMGYAVNTSIQYYGISSVEKQLIEQTNSSLDYIKQILYLQDQSTANISVDISERITKELSAGNREIRLYDENLNLLSAYIDGIKQSPYTTKIFDTNLKEAAKGNYAYVSDGQFIYFAAPIELNRQTSGIFEIVYPLDLLNQILSNTTYVLIFAGIVYIIFIIILSFYLAKVTVKPIKKLVNAADRYSNHDFAPIEIDGPYEIEQLSNSISFMGQKVQDYINRQNQFVSNVSHELRTPLTAIKGYSEFLIDEVKGNKDLEKAVFHLNNETERLTKMVNELLILSRMDADDEIYNMKRVNLSKLIEDILESLKMRIKTEHILLHKDLETDVNIVGDPQKLIQVILNVMDNAIKYSKGDKVIKFSLSKENNKAVIEVEDKGIGIDELEADKIFERFYRAKNVKALKGTGLGLAISKEIIHGHNGLIAVESKKGQGTKVKIALPICDELLQV